MHSTNQYSRWRRHCGSCEVTGCWGHGLKASRRHRLHSVFGGRGPCREEVQVCRSVALPPVTNFFVDFELLNLQCRKDALYLLCSNVLIPVDQHLHESSMPYETPSHSPFIPDISMTSPDIRFQSLKASSKGNFFQNQHSAMSPLQLRTLSSPSTIARTSDREHFATTPNVQSRHSFPPQFSASVVSITPKPLASSSKSPPQGGRYTDSSPPSNLTGAASSKKVNSAAGVGTAARAGHYSK